MLFKRLLGVIIVLVASNCWADTEEQTYREIANDLASLKSSIDLAAQQQTTMATPSQLIITENDAKLLSGANPNSKTIAQVKKGNTYKILDKTYDWYAVALDDEINGQTSAWVNASSAVPVDMALVTETQTKTFADELYDEILKKVNRYKEKYKDNPYVKVSGFSVNLGVLPSVSISFEFEE